MSTKKKLSEMKSTRGWMIKRGNYQFFSTIRSLRRESQNVLCELTGFTWRIQKADGFECVRVTINEEVKP